MAEKNPNVLDQDQVAELLGYKSISYAERVLEAEGIRPFHGRPGYWFITIDQLNAARGISRWMPENDDDGGDWL